MKISLFRYHITKYSDDPNLVSQCIHYSIMELCIFIKALNDLKKSATIDKRKELDIVEPIITWLNSYKRGLQRYRNKRVAHMGSLKKLSIEYFKKYNLPFSVSDFNRMFLAADFLSNYILVIYVIEAKAISERTKEKIHRIQNPQSTVNHDIDMPAVKEQIERKIISMDPPLNPKLLKHCLTYLQNLE